MSGTSEAGGGRFSVRPASWGVVVYDNDYGDWASCVWGSAGEAVEAVLLNLRAELKSAGSARKAEIARDIAELEQLRDEVVG